ncbi:MAG: sugar phosphate isomerase/epimerase [Rhodospirillales bacterium]
MKPMISLAHLTAIDLAPPELIRLAARTGSDGVGLRLVRVTDTSPGYPLMDDPAMLRETKAALKDTGIVVHDIEFIRITPEIDLPPLARVFETGAELGARHVITAPYDEDHGRFSQSLGALADLAAEFGLGTVMEFFPWTSVPDLATAWEVVAASGDKAGVLVDMLHFDRSHSRIEDLAKIPPHRLPFMHLCDAPVQPSYTLEELLQAGRAERLPPGEGQIDLLSILPRMPAGIPVALEVPMTALTASAGAETVLRKVKSAADGVLKLVEYLSSVNATGNGLEETRSGQGTDVDDFFNQPARPE